jgi:predicted AAA+ superfamily ATPase
MKRVFEDPLQSFMEDFPCVAILGVRQCGKTTLLKTLPVNWKQMDLERRAGFEMVAR